MKFGVEQYEGERLPEHGFKQQNLNLNIICLEKRYWHMHQLWSNAFQVCRNARFDIKALCCPKIIDLKAANYLLCQHSNINSLFSDYAFSSKFNWGIAQIATKINNIKSVVIQSCDQERCWVCSGWVYLTRGHQIGGELEQKQTNAYATKKLF